MLGFPITGIGSHGLPLQPSPEPGPVSTQAKPDPNRGRYGPNFLAGTLAPSLRLFLEAATSFEARSIVHIGATILLASLLSPVAPLRAAGLRPRKATKMPLRTSKPQSGTTRRCEGDYGVQTAGKSMENSRGDLCHYPRGHTPIRGDEHSGDLTAGTRCGGLTNRLRSLGRGYPRIWRPVLQVSSGAD